MSMKRSEEVITYYYYYYYYRLSKDRQFSFSILVEVFDISSQSKPDFDPQLTRKLGFTTTALWVLKNTEHTNK